MADHFDIVATMPEGSKRDDAPAMLQSLLVERFKLVAHLETQEHPVLALVVGQLLVLAVSLPAWWRSPYFHRGMLRIRFDRDMTLRLATFSVMTLTSALVPPLGIVVFRHA